MATLTNTKIKDTYDGLLKTTNNEAIAASGVTLIEDGLGNASALSVGRSGNGVTITGSLNATLATAAQPNITSVGTLSSLAVSGNLAVDTNTLYVDASNNRVGIGESSPDYDLHIASTLGFPVLIERTNAADAGIRFKDSTTTDADQVRLGARGNDLQILTGGSETMRITSGGDVLFNTQGIPNGTSVYGSAFEASTNARSLLKLASSSTIDNNLVFFYNPNGLVGRITTSGSSTSYNTSSDYRLKENVVPMEGALDRVDALKPSRFNFIADAETTVDGFLAHEVQAIVPEAVTGEKDAVDEEGNPVYQGIDQSKIVPLLVGAIQELRAEIELLKNK